MESQVRQQSRNAVTGNTGQNVRTNGIYAIYDRIAEDYSQLFEASNDAIAVRNYRQAMTNNPYQEDYYLVLLGKCVRINQRIEIIPFDNQQIINTIQLQPEIEDAC